MSFENPYESPSTPPNPEADRYNAQANQWAMFVHLSQLANCIAPSAGIIAPIVLWQIKKDEFPVIDQHGKMVTNWLISAFIYGVASVLLCFTIIGMLVGIPALFLLGIAGVVFPIIGGIKANNGEFWPYPLTIQFLK